MSEPSRPNRSVVDFETEDQLRKALMAGEVRENLDWVLPEMDTETTEVQSMKEELHRLQILKSYLILDADREEAFERITGICSRVFQVPIALVSLVDLGRQWFMSNRGLGDVRETPRKHAFCAHAILSKGHSLIVPDATLDFRFRNNPLVTGPPHIRFYAGFPLISPEGYKLGTLCIIDNKTRMDGLTPDEQATMRDLADMVVKEMVDRRYKMHNQENPAQLIAYTAHDLLTPLTGVQLSLTLLNEDEDLLNKLSAHQKELLSTASTCSDLMIRICQTAMESLRKETPLVDTPGNRPPVTRLSELVSSLNLILEPLPKTVPLVITLDPDVPQSIVSDDLKIFRSALNLMSNAIHRTELGNVHLKIFPVEEGTKLMFECQDTAPDIDVEEYPYLFQPSRTMEGDLRLGLSSTAVLINALDGEYGFRPRGVNADGSPESSPRQSGSVFWFSIPLIPAESIGVALGNDAVAVLPSARKTETRGPIKLPIIPSIHKSSSFLSSAGRLFASTSTGSFRKTGSGSSISSANRSRLSLLVSNAFQAEAVQNSCFGGCFETEVKSPAPSPKASAAERLAAMHPRIQPDERKEPAKIPAMVGSPKGKRKRWALVVDDSLVVRKSLASALRKLKYEVDTAVNGQEGLTLLKEKLFDVVYMDFLMPVMDGMDCVKQYRDWEATHRPWYRQFIVGISAHATANDGGEGLKAGMDDFRAKPLSVKILSEIHSSEVATNQRKKLDSMDYETEDGNAEEVAVVRNDLEEFHGNVPQQAEFRAPPAMVPPAAIPPESRPGFPSLVASDKRPASGLSLHLEMPKRARSSSFSAQLNTSEQVCLIATDRPTQQPHDVLRKLEFNGWKAVVVHDGQEALRLLRMRNWNAVLIDDDLPMISGAKCMIDFRQWEERNRVNRQKNVFFVCSYPVPSPFEESSVVQPPFGFDGVLGKPVSWDDMQCLVQKKKDASNMEIVFRN